MKYNLKAEQFSEIVGLYVHIGEFRENINIEYQHWEFTSHNTWLCFKLLMMRQKKVITSKTEELF